MLMEWKASAKTGEGSIYCTQQQIMWKLQTKQSSAEPKVVLYWILNLPYTDTNYPLYSFTIDLVT